jgi:hypothetical protein
MVRHLEIYRPGDTIEFHVNIFNSLSKSHSMIKHDADTHKRVHEKCHDITDEALMKKCHKKYSTLDDVKVKAYFIDTGDMGYGYSSDTIVAGEKIGKWVFFDIPKDMAKGDYTVRVVASSDEFKDVKYTYVTII